MSSISPFLIGVDNIEEMLPTILTNSIVLDNRFIIKGINQNVLDLLGYTGNELLERDINCFIEDRISSHHQRDLATGFSRKTVCTADKRKRKNCCLHIRVLYGTYQRHQ